MRHFFLVLPALSLLLLPRPSGAVEPEELALARYHADGGRWLEAGQHASALLAEAPEEFALHRIYIEAWSRQGEAEHVQAQYRAWLEASPDNELRRTLLGFALASDRRTLSERCEEFTALHSPLPQDLDTRYWALITLRRIYVLGDCPGDMQANTDALMELEGKAPSARTWHVAQALSSEPVERDIARRLKRLVRDEPWRMHAASRLWREGASGERLDQARKDSLAAAERGSRSEHPAVVDAAAAVLEASGDVERADALRSGLPAEEGMRKSSPVLRAISKARKRLSPQASLEALEAIAETIPAEGPERARYEDARAGVLQKLGRTEESLEAAYQAWKAQPDSAGAANFFAWSAVLAGERLEEALTVIEHGLRVLDERPFERAGRSWRPGFEAWQDSRERSLGMYEDTRGWILYRLGRHEEAAASLRRAVRLAPDAVQHAHLGLVYEALGQDEPAVEHLLQGVLGGLSSEDGLDLAARSALEELWPAQGYWHPEGLDGYLALRRALAAEEDDEEEPGADSGSEKQHELVGQTFPDLAITVGGEEQKLSDYEGLRVVDMWATWCGPCVAGMPHLDELATEYTEQGVQFLAVSVDSELQDVTTFFEGADPQAYQVAWAGREALDEIGIRGIPAVFILDGEGTILAMIRGYSSGDTRLDEALEEVLAEPEAESSSGG